jgi:ribosome-associated protein
VSAIAPAHAGTNPERTLLRTTNSATAAKPLSTGSSSGVRAVEDALAAVIASLEDSKAEEIITINIEGKTPIADRLVIASGRSHRHVAAVAEHLITALKEKGLGTPRIEGMPSADWVLIDQGDIIIHVFRPEVRAFYNLEKMWQLPDLDSDGTVH